MSGGIYTASMTKHALHWHKFRAKGFPVVSSWIDEAGPGESPSMRDLWIRNVNEAALADALVLYHETGDVLKGAFVEVGAALAFHTPVLVVGDPPGSWVDHPLVQRHPNLSVAMKAALAFVEDDRKSARHVRTRTK